MVKSIATRKDEHENKQNSNLYKQKIENFRKKVEHTFLKEISEGKTVGSISELYDSKKPYESKGAIAQAWSVAEIYRIIFSK